ncbi:unnamed protein product, partial [Prorocentrum cordatum]
GVVSLVFHVGSAWIRELGAAARVQRGLLPTSSVGERVPAPPARGDPAAAAPPAPSLAQEQSAELEAARVDFHWGDGVSFTDSAVPGRGSAVGVHYGAGELDGRLVGSLVEYGELAVVSPDFDVCERDPSLNNGGREGIRFLCSVNVWPRGVPALGCVLYTFATLLPARVNELSAEADQVSNLEQAQRGSPLEGEAARAPGVIAVVWTPLPALGPTPGAPRLAPTDGAWVAAELLGNHDIREESALPAGAEGLGFRDLVVIDGGVAVLEQLGVGSDLTRWGLAQSNSLCDDPRILARSPTERPLADAAPSMTACPREEDAVLQGAMLLVAVVDGLNEKNLVDGELLLRRIPEHGEAAEESLETQAAVPVAAPVSDMMAGVRKARLHLKRWNAVQSAAQEAVDGVNLLFGCHPQELLGPTLRDGAEAVGGCNPVHSAIHQHLFSTIASGMPDHVQSDHASFRELAGVNADYEMLACAVEPYDPTKVPLPEGQVSPVVLADFVSPELGRSLDLDNILADADVGKITPFFVKAKQGPQRLVLDCRRVNQMFRHPPKPEMSSAENMHGLEAPDEASPVFVATGDIHNCFYQCGVPSALSEYFSFEAVALHAELLREAGFGQDLIMSNAWLAPPHPPLTDDPVAPPYCDSLAVFGMSRERVDQRLRELIGVFEGEGFVLREISWASTSSDIPGTAFDGVRGSISGKTLERLLGHYVVEALNQRPALSVLRASYAFTRDCYWTPRPLWGSVCRELLVCSSLVPLLSGNFGRPWSTSALATDASGSGWGVMEAGFDGKDVKEIGGWNERWRYERAPPSEWAPRRRAPAAELDPLVDPVTSEAGPWDLDVLGGAPSKFAWRPRAADPEIPKAAILGRSWKCWRAWRCRLEEPIGNKEGRAVIRGMSLELLDPCQHRKRRLVLVDNFGVPLCFSRGRAASFGLLQLVRRLAPLSIAAGAWVALRWIPSECNPADEPSRLFEKAKEARATLCE